MASAAPVNDERVHVVILLHGIRTRAFWYDLVQPVLSEIDGIVVKPLGYDYFSALRLIIPFFRGGPARKIAEDIQDIQGYYDRQNKRVRFSVIAHSFGTYTIGSLLQKTRNIDLHHLVMCGSVLPIRYDFEYISRKVHGKLVNDAGARDAWPVLAKFGSWGYGASGTFGFQSALIEDRFHDFSHSDFFNEQFIREFWFPIFSREEIAKSKYVRKRSWRQSLLSILATWPSGTLLTVLVAATLYFTGTLQELYRLGRGIHVEFAQIDAERAKSDRVTAPVVTPSGSPAAPTTPTAPVTPAGPVTSDDDIIARIIKWEGGVSHGLPGDPSSVENAGVGVKDWSLYSGQPATPDTIKNLTRSQIFDFYRAVFLQRPGVKDIQNIVVKGALVDMMVFAGPPGAVRAFQSALNSTTGANLPVDGQLNPSTVAAINSVKNPNLLIEAASCVRIKAVSPSFAQFVRRRLRDFLPGTLTGVCPEL